MNAFNKNSLPRRSDSPAYKADTLNDRLNTAGQAKQAMLARFRARPEPNDPAMLERQATQVALSEARDARMADRRAARDAEAERLAAAQVEREAEAVRQAEAAAVLAVEQAAQAESLKVEQKAARDARYAARQARRR